MTIQNSSPETDLLVSDETVSPLVAVATPDQPLDQTEPLEEVEPTALQLVELLLKNPAGVDRLNRQPELQRLLFPRFLLIAQISYLAFGVVLLLLLNVAPADAYPHLPNLAPAFSSAFVPPKPLASTETLPPWLTMPPASWRDGSALALPLAYMIGIVLAAGVCLPSFYFYGLLAGVKLNWLQITSLVGKGMASNAILLLGLLPAYVALVLGLIVFEAPVDWLQGALLLGLLLPFVSGVWGMWAIYQGTRDLASVLPQQWHCQRWCFLRRLVLSWSAVYTVVVPVMIYRLWEYFATQMGAG
jgi:hypothetical protein